MYWFVVYLQYIIIVSIFSFISANRCVQEPEPVALKAQPKWAIVCLSRKLKELGRRNKLLANAIQPYAKSHDIDMIVFSEVRVPVTLLQQWQKTFDGIAKVKAVNTYDRGFLQPDGSMKFGYKYMCKFFMLDIYDFLNEYDYYMRLDSDDYMIKLNSDVFKWIENNEVEYGWAARKIEGHGPTRQTLPHWTEVYTQECEIKPTAIMDHPLSKCFNFYNNFHIGKVSFFNRPDVKHYLLAVNSSGKVESLRWGDSTIQAYAVRLFMDPRRIRMVPDVAFAHGSHGNRVISTLEKGKGNTLPASLGYWIDPRLEE